MEIITNIEIFLVKIAWHDLWVTSFDKIIHKLTSASYFN